MAAALAEARSMRIATVRMPRITSQQSNGDGTAPAAFWWKRSFSSRSSRRVASSPLITSECPDRYFVAECMTMSAPSSSGRCRNGVANVLSTTVSAPETAATRARAAMSTTFSNGLVGVSSQTMRGTGALLRAAASASTWERSTQSVCTP
jgi:hypothetical protein